MLFKSSDKCDHGQNCFHYNVFIQCLDAAPSGPNSDDNQRTTDIKTNIFYIYYNNSQPMIKCHYFLIAIFT